LIEQASARVTIDMAVHALIAMGAVDEELAAPFNAGANGGVQTLRQWGLKRFLRPRNSAFPTRSQGRKRELGI
jgi:hypothetical protein